MSECGANNLDTFERTSTERDSELIISVQDAEGGFDKVHLHKLSVDCDMPEDITDEANLPDEDVTEGVKFVNNPTCNPNPNLNAYRTLTLNSVD